MIHVDRTSVPPPLSLVRGWEVERQQAREFYAVPEDERRQRRFAFRSYNTREVREALVALFNGKCAYCESQIAVVGSVDIEHFRPKGGVVRSDGSFLPDHYWWLAGEWSNLYTACAACNRMRHLGGGGLVSKGDRFPLEDEASRVPLEATPDQIAAERPLLLDPCVDMPEDHLVFQEDGTVVSDTLRGQMTIEVIGLNRSGLVAARRTAAIRVKMLIQAIKTYLATDAHEELERAIRELEGWTDAKQEYAALTRQLVGAFRSSLDEALREQLAGGVAQPASKRRAARTRYRAFVREQEDFSLACAEDVEIYRRVGRFVERVTIKNVKAIRSLELDLTRSSAATTPWTVLLGKNASGKSTILQGITLALVGRQGVERLGLDPRAFVRRARGVRSGSVSVRLSGSTRDRTLVFNSRGFEFDNAEDPQTLVLAYGETRLLPGQACRWQRANRGAGSRVCSDRHGRSWMLSAGCSRPTRPRSATSGERSATSWRCPSGSG